MSRPGSLSKETLLDALWPHLEDGVGDRAGLRLTYRALCEALRKVYETDPDELADEGDLRLVKPSPRTEAVYKRLEANL